MRAASAYFVALGLVLALAAAAGCSGTETIAKNTNQVRALATSSRDRFYRIADETDKPTPAIPVIRTEAQHGANEQEGILDAVDAIYLGLTGVDDVVPWWGRVLVYAMLALSIVGVGFLTWYSGLGAFLNRALAHLMPNRLEPATAAGKASRTGGRGTASKRRKGP